MICFSNKSIAEMVAMKPMDVLILAIHVLTLNSGVRTVVVLQ
jgi:hypothetical protein